MNYTFKDVEIYTYNDGAYYAVKAMIPRSASTDLDSLKIYNSYKHNWKTYKEAKDWAESNGFNVIR